jgi:hypothetical protein
MKEKPDLDTLLMHLRDEVHAFLHYRDMTKAEAMMRPQIRAMLRWFKGLNEVLPVKRTRKYKPGEDIKKDKQ